MLAADQGDAPVAYTDGPEIPGLMGRHVKRVLLAVSVAVAGLGALLVLRTLMLPCAQGPAEPFTPIPIDADAAAQRLAKALTFRTISRDDAPGPAAEALVGFQAFVREAFPKVHQALELETVAGYSLLFRWPGSDPALLPALLMGHQDVVDAPAQTLDDWTHPPFAGRIADGYVWGRGAMDFKVGVMAILEAVETLLGKGFTPRRTLYFAFGHDEEVGGSGAEAVAAVLQQRGVRLEFALDEGLFVAEGVLPVGQPVALIGTAEKGYVTIHLRARADGGHSAMPPRHTTIGRLSRAISRLEDNLMPAKVEGPVGDLFRMLAPRMDFGRRLVIANLWLLEPLLVAQLEKSPATNALVRTTAAATVFASGVKENVLPPTAEARVNFRTHPADTRDDVLQHVRRVVDDPLVELDVGKTLRSGRALVSSPHSESYKLLAATIRQVFPDALVAPSLMIAATDGRYMTDLTDNVFRFTPMRVTTADRVRFHGLNERLSVDGYGDCVRFYGQLMTRAAGEPQR